MPTLILAILFLTTTSFFNSAFSAGPGDANNDGSVDGIDYVIWLKNFNKSTNNGSSDADFNANGFVDGIDYVIWLNNYGQTPNSTPTPTVALSAGEPSPPYYTTFFYPWSQNPNTDGKWSYWSDVNNNPPNTWFSHYLPDPDPSRFDPQTELYSSKNDSIIYWQLDKIREAKIGVAISSWWGQGHKTDSVFSHIIKEIMKRPDNPHPNLRWALYYEWEGFADHPAAEIANNLNYIAANYANEPGYLKINGKPVIFVYGGANDTATSGYHTRWAQANTLTNTKFYVVLKVFSGFQNVSPQPDSWHQYAPAVRSGGLYPYYFFVSPGFWLDDGSPIRLERNLTAFRQAVTEMVNSSATWKIIETWNEWGEGSSVEPGEQTKIDSSGLEVIDPNGAPFKNQYIDTLKQLIPENNSSAPFPSPTAVAGFNPVVVAAGDIVCGTASTGAACKHIETANLIQSINPDAVLLLGDNQYESGSASDFQNFYNPSWGKFKNITYPAVGNHEYGTAGANGYFDYFNGVGNQSGPAGDRSKGYYAFNLGSWRLYALNSNCSQVGGCAAGSPQESWLRSDLLANPNQCVLAYWHHPLYASGGLTSTAVKPLYQALYDNNAELILTGHEHFYERFAPQDANGKAVANGIRQIIAGTGGRNFTGFLPTAANSEIKNNTTFGVLKLTLHPNSYDLNFVPITGSAFTDFITNQQCH